MWYFSAILGLFLVSFFAILNAMWIELDYDDNGHLRPQEDDGESAEDNCPTGRGS